MDTYASGANGARFRRLASRSRAAVSASSAALLPRLLYERLDEFGFDFTVLYPTAGLAVGYIPEDEIRRASCRAFNMYIGVNSATSAIV